MIGRDDGIRAGAAVICALADLPERDREIVVLREFHEWTWQRLGDRYGISRERARQIHARATDDLARSLERFRQTLLEAAA